MTIHEHLKSIDACKEVQEWAKTRLTGQQCWDEANKIEWLFWWTSKTGQVEGVAKCAGLIAESVKRLKNSDAATFAAADAAAYATYAAAAAAAYAAANAAANAADATYAAAAAAAYAAAAYAADAAAAIFVADAAAYAAIFAAANTTYATTYTAAYKKQQELNLKIARENLTCPFPF